ncbi:hypothetical protein ABKN59_006759 [Abortiporus biennis]
MRACMYVIMSLVSFHFGEKRVDFGLYEYISCISFSVSKVASTARRLTKAIQIQIPRPSTVNERDQPSP